MNLGCGSVQPEGWDNADAHSHGQRFSLEILGRVGETDRGLTMYFPHDEHVLAYDRHNSRLVHMVDYDYIVCNHMLSDIGHHDLVPALRNIRSMLRDGGVLRILVPNVAAAFVEMRARNEAWFPQDERTGDIDAKFCTFVTWFGESRSVFTPWYLVALLKQAGFSPTTGSIPRGVTFFGPPEIVELDGDRTTSLIVEAKK